MCISCVASRIGRLEIPGAVGGDWNLVLVFAPELVVGGIVDRNTVLRAGGQRACLQWRAVVADKRDYRRSLVDVVNHNAGCVGDVASRVLAAEVNSAVFGNDNAVLRICLPFAVVADAVFLRDGVLAEHGCHGDIAAGGACHVGNWRCWCFWRNLVYVGDLVAGGVNDLALRVKPAEQDSAVVLHRHAAFGIVEPGLSSIRGVLSSHHVLVELLLDDDSAVGGFGVVWFHACVLARLGADVAECPLCIACVASCIGGLEVPGAVGSDIQLACVLSPVLVVGGVVDVHAVLGACCERGGLQWRAVVACQRDDWCDIVDVVECPLRISCVARRICCLEVPGPVGGDWNLVLVFAPELVVGGIVDRNTVLRAGGQRACLQWRAVVADKRDYRRSLVDVVNHNAGCVGDVASRVLAAEVNSAVFGNDNAVLRICLPFAVVADAVFLRDGVLAEHGCHGDIAAGGACHVGNWRCWCFWRNLVYVGDLVAGGVNDLALRVKPAEQDSAVVLHCHTAFGIVEPGLAAIRGVLAGHHVLVELLLDDDSAVGGLGAVCFHACVFARLGADVAEGDLGIASIASCIGGLEVPGAVGCDVQRACVLCPVLVVSGIEDVHAILCGGCQRSGLQWCAVVADQFYHRSNCVDI